MFKDIVLKNRSYRGFDEQHSFTKKDLSELVEYARYTPSSANIQPLKFCLVYDKEQVKKIQSLTKWAGYLSELNLPYEGKKPTGFILVCQDTDISKNSAAFQKDVGIVSQTILLAAAEKELGGCMIGSFEKNEIQSMLPSNLEVQLVIALGKPLEEIVIVDADDDIKYYRDKNDTHYVPKRKLCDLIFEVE